MTTPETAAEEHRREPSTRRRTLVLGSPPNPNGDLHLGHMAGPYLSADVFARHRRMLGEDAYVVFGSDDNQCWTAAKAEQIGMAPQEAADFYSEKITATLERARIDVAHFYRPNAWPPYAELLEEIVRKLYDQGDLVVKEKPALFSAESGRYLFEVFVAGTCPHCRTPTYGNGCETCGLPNECVDLIDPVEKATGKTPVVRPARRLYFPLEPHRERIERHIAAIDMGSQQRALCRRALERELPDIVASHPTDWGLKVPIEGFEDHRLSAWIELAPGYVAGSWALARELGLGDWRSFWCSDDAQVVELFGSDNGWFHGIFYPLLLEAFEPEVRRPRALVTFQLYRLEGEKFSTSRGHAVWARDLIERSSVDEMRFYVGYTAPEAEQTSFSMAEFDRFVEDELVGRWQGWLGELDARLLVAGPERRAPEAGDPTPEQRRFERRVEKLLVEARESYAPAGFSLQRLTRVACELVRLARDFGKAEAAWEQVSPAGGERATALALELAAARGLALVVAPIMPDFAGRLWRCLGCPGAVEDQRWEDELHPLAPGQAVSGLDGSFFPLPVD